MAQDLTHRINNPSISLDRVEDNKLLINNKEYFGLDTTNVIVGSDASIDHAKEVYNLRVQSHNNWLFLDLETGGRGWFPGSKLIGYTIEPNVFMYRDEDETSPVVLHIIDTDHPVWVLNDREYEQEGEWYYCNCDDFIGYIKRYKLKNLSFQ